MLKVLVVEDEALSRMALIGHVRSLLGAEALIEGAANGREAVDLAARISPQLIFMDIEMPVLSGLEAAEIIRRRQPDVRIVFLTAFDRFDYAVGALRAGGSDYLLKPFQRAEIDKYLRELAGEPAAPAPADSDFQLQFSVWLQHHYAEDVSLENAAESMGMSSFYFSRLFRTSFNKTFLEYLTGYRIERACRLLESTEIPVREVAALVGYADSNYFSKVFKRQTGRTPTEYRQSVELS